MTLKIRKIGNSQGIVIPKKLLEEAGLKSGESVVIERKNGNLTIIPEKHKKANGIDVKFIKMVDEFITEHEDVLQKLAKK